MALAHRPALLLLDEPLVGLDAVSQRDIITELLAAVQDEQRTVLISSHNLDAIERFTDHLGILVEGKMLLEGPTTDLVERFRMVDCEVANGFNPGTVAGVYIQTHEGQRWRVLVDTAGDTLERLRAKGATTLAETPVTLEDLFVGLVKGQ